MNKKTFNPLGVNLTAQPDARMRECPAPSTLAALEKRFGEDKSPHLHTAPRHNGTPRAGL